MRRARLRTSTRCRALVIDELSAAELKQLHNVSDRIVARIDAD